MKFTGERFMPDLTGNIQLEHMHRYLIAMKITNGKVVLDIASGEGYGSAMLARNALKVIGVDICKESIQHAQNKYKYENLKFIHGSCSSIPLEDFSVDVVVSFETIEHHDAHQAMLREIKRVLRPQGIVIISSPDKLEYSDKTGYSNPFHAKELYRDEFDNLLKSNFNNSCIYGQRVVYGSAIFPEILCNSRIVSYQSSDDSFEENIGISRPLYLIGVASDMTLPFLEGGIFEQAIEDIDIVKLCRQELTKYNGEIEALNQELTKCSGEIEALNQIISMKDDLISGLSESLFEIKNSKSWKLTFPLRFFVERYYKK